MHADHTQPLFELLISPEVMGCTTSTLEIPGMGGGGYLCVQKLEIPGRGGRGILA